MNLFEPCRPVRCDQMRPEEADGLDVLLHILRPEVVVETGTLHGGSAKCFSRHARVITVDPAPDVSPGQLVGDPFPITMKRGRSPEDLSAIVLPELEGVGRWLFFHDSEHYADQLEAEVHWAFAHGALAAVWHDVGLRWHGWEQRGTMLDGLRKLQEKGYAAERLQHFGLDETNWEIRQPHIWTGIGMAWPKP